jgi:hypothetical protein
LNWNFQVTRGFLFDGRSKANNSGFISFAAPLPASYTTGSDGVGEAIMLLPPNFHFFSCIFQRIEPIIVSILTCEAAVERFNISIIRRYLGLK